MPGGRPSKPIHLVQGHRTKAEKAIRQKAESELLTGHKLKESEEIKNNPIAHKEFSRVKKLLKAIGKDDDLSGNIINMHCMIYAECKEIEDTKERFINNLDDFKSRSLGVCDDEMSFSEKIKIQVSMQKQILDCDRALMAKRKMLLDISKENIMTIQSALRSVPKKPEKKEQSKMAVMLEKRQMK